MRLLKDHICEIRSTDEYWFDMDRMVFKNELLSLPESEMPKFIDMSFEKMYASENRKIALTLKKEKVFKCESFVIEGSILKVKVDISYRSIDYDPKMDAKKTTTKYKTAKMNFKRNDQK